MPSVNRRARKRIRLIALAVLSLIALSVGWMLGKTVMGPSQVDQSQPSVSVHSAVEDKGAESAYAGDSNGNDKNMARIAAASALEAKAVDAEESQSSWQDGDAQQGGAVEDEKLRPNRKGSYPNSSRREFVSANARKGPGIGIVTRPIKAVFKPLKKANPFKLRIW
jgi:hypothetical protein